MNTSDHTPTAGNETTPDFSTLSTVEKRFYANAYAKRVGMAAFPVAGKIPNLSGSWKPLVVAVGVRGTPEQWSTATGYALSPLPGSAGAIIDIDQPAFYDALIMQFPRLRQTFTVRRGERFHLYIELASAPAWSILSIESTVDRSEVASLRAAGAYVVGPRSDHESGESYRHVSGERPAKLSQDESERLIALFAPAPPKVIARPLYEQDGDREDLIRACAAVLESRGYRSSSEWQNGRCIHPENHKNGDQHRSAGFSRRTGVFHCFRCGDFSLVDVAGALGIPSGRVQVESDRPFAFECEAPSTLPADAMRSELNITTALIRRKAYRAARLNDVLANHSRDNAGQHTYTTSEIKLVAHNFGLTASQIQKSLVDLVKLGLLEKLAHGRYRRVGHERAAELLNIGSEYAPITLPTRAYSNLADFRRAVMLATQRALPANLPSAKIARAAGISTRTLYNHENRLGIQRTPNLKRANPATAAISFVKVFNRVGKVIKVVRGDNAAHQALEAYFEDNDRSIWGWKQSPSTRILSGNFA